MSTIRIGSERLTHPDQLRAVAILLMVLVHAVATWTPRTISRTGILAMSISGLGGLAAPLFVTIAGWGMARSKLTPRKVVVRSAFIFAAQFIVNISAPHLFEPFTPGVLSLFAITILLSPIWLKAIRTKSRNGVPAWPPILTILLFIPWITPESFGLPTWDWRVHTPTPARAFSHLLLTGTYPLIPWLSFAILGAIIADNQHSITTLNNEDKSTKETRITSQVWLVISLGIAFFLLAIIESQRQGIPLAMPAGYAVLTFFPANTPFLISAFAGVGILWQFTKNIPHSPALVALGQRSLTVYVLHFIPFALLHNIDEEYNIQAIGCILMVVTYTILWIPLAKLHANTIPNWSLEHLLRNFVHPKRKLEV
ncbi:MAG: heparan-alpha-glucosaminide N-acetyltransferase domain-containing protein [Candidatus Poseidoniaceae archaeon]|jgi:peptidoglycan/LPS O-acetylase OafA/YrhL|nr:heparan-alpha-glucosaminide N-acetyltransferase domain-containing protein [Candidatus Poseidoniaceae archaeon]MDP7000317.1 heparan-alpha-glucosaminide N-acetyltransferase domain-containing protein [Candidatus Poseidoniaceae archaeon]